MTGKLSIDFAACDGHGLCADLLPELVSLDEWGFPVLQQAGVDSRLLPHARRAAATCPVLALHLARNGTDDS